MGNSQQSKQESQLSPTLKQEQQQQQPPQYLNQQNQEPEYLNCQEQNMQNDDEYQNCNDLNYQQIPNQIQQQQQQQQIIELSLSRIAQVEKEDMDLPLAGLIITVKGGCSYDELFTKIKQQPEEGTRIRVYQASPQIFVDIVLGMQGKEETYQNQEIQDLYLELLEDFKVLDAENVVFNFECSSGYHNSNVDQGSKKTWDCIKYLLDNKFYLMYSDFSLQALVNSWNTAVLGPNPFTVHPKISGSYEIQFEPETFKNSPSSQLQKVGELCNTGVCQVKSSSWCYSFSFNQKIADNQAYTADLYSIVKTDIVKQLPVEQRNTINGVEGLSGHVLLTYPSGGRILTSMGHWVELVEIDTTKEQLIEVARNNWGDEYANNMVDDMQSMDKQEQQQYVNCNAAQFVQQSAPMKQNYNTKRKFKQ